MNVPRSTTATLIAAARELAATIQCDDGVANAALGEIADRLEELQPLVQAAIEFAAAEHVANDAAHSGRMGDLLTIEAQAKDRLFAAAREVAESA